MVRRNNIANYLGQFNSQSFGYYFVVIVANSYRSVVSKFVFVIFFTNLTGFLHMGPLTRRATSLACSWHVGPVPWHAAAGIQQASEYGCI